ncbi:MAG: hypothetical protein Q8O88_03910 [bacterium]|nr:hypothetical protein [bacterium]
MKNYQKKKDKAVKDFYKLLNEARKLVKNISKNNKIELEANGVTFVMIDPFDDDGFLSDVVSVENGDIELENGSIVNVNDVTNLTDLIGLLETIDE